MDERYYEGRRRLLGRDGEFVILRYGGGSTAWTRTLRFGRSRATTDEDAELIEDGTTKIEFALRFDRG